MAHPPRYELTRRSLVGRGYDLVRDGEPAGELRRRGIFRERYEIDCGAHRWLVHGLLGNADKPAELTDRSSGDVLARWDPQAPVDVTVPAWRPRLDLAWGDVGDDRAFATPDGGGWVTFATRKEAMKAYVEVAGPSADWPADEPDPSFLLFVALGLARIVWHIDQSAARSV